MNDLVKNRFSIGTLSVGDLALRVRYCCRRRDSTRVASLPSENEQQHREQEGRPIGFGATPPADPKEGEICHDAANEGCGDGTGLLVWPGSRLLASFLVDPSGARRFFPQALATSPCGSSCEEGSSTRPKGCDGKSLIDGGQKTVDPAATPGLGDRSGPVLLPEPYGEITGDQEHVVLGNMPLQGHMAEGPEIRRNVPPAAKESFRGEGCGGAASKSTETQPALRETGGVGAAPHTRTTPRTESPAVLELGAGTGICGMAASLAWGCPVILTDRREDVLANIRENIELNGLGQRAKVVQLAWGDKERETSELPAEIRNQSAFKIILASDTVYPGKPLSDAEAFFAMVSALLDPVEGILLLAYTPRQPSIGTENMLRCAYRAGLRGEALVNDIEDGWKIGSGPDTTKYGISRTSSSHSSCEVYGRQDNIDKVRNPKHDREDRQAVAQRNQDTTQLCGSLSHAGATPPKLLLRNIVATSRGCRPVLLCFRLYPGLVVEGNTTMPTSSNNGEGALPGSTDLPPSSAGRAPDSLSESAWLSEWESVFPDLRKRTRGERDVASETVKALACRRGVENTDDDAVTGEYLWGDPSVELDTGKEG